MSINSYRGSSIPITAEGKVGWLDLLLSGGSRRISGTESSSPLYDAMSSPTPRPFSLSKTTPHVMEQNLQPCCRQMRSEAVKQFSSDNWRALCDINSEFLWNQLRPMTCVIGFSQPVNQLPWRCCFDNRAERDSSFNIMAFRGSYRNLGAFIVFDACSPLISLTPAETRPRKALKRPGSIKMVPH
jgi:hypothetical protein